MLTGASVDYSSFLASEKETEGIRVLQGDGLVILKWTDVETLRVMRRDDSVKPPRLELVTEGRNKEQEAAECR